VQCSQSVLKRIDSASKEEQAVQHGGIQFQNYAPNLGLLRYKGIMTI
jgi:hypothetical protein